jgi:hypothetical protein
MAIVKISLVAFLLVACVAQGCAREAGDTRPPELKGLSQEQVRERLGNPLEVRAIEHAPAPEDATDEEKEIYARETGTEKWVYAHYTVVFNVNKLAIGVITK